MQDKNIAIRQAYYNLLNGVVKYNSANVPIYNLVVSNSEQPDLYILINQQNSTGRETKCNQDREMNISVTICTRLPINNGWECDVIAGEVLNAIYPTRQTTIAGTKSIRLANDVTLFDYDSEAKKQIVERTITFNHIY